MGATTAGALPTSTTPKAEIPTSVSPRRSTRLFIWPADKTSARLQLTRTLIRSGRTSFPATCPGLHRAAGGRQHVRAVPADHAARHGPGQTASPCSTDPSNPNCLFALPGINPVDGNLLQVMPWPVFNNMSNDDLLAIYTYLSAIPCITGPATPADLPPTSQYAFKALHNDCTPPKSN